MRVIGLNRRGFVHFSLFDRVESTYPPVRKRTTDWEKLATLVDIICYLNFSFYRTW